MQHGHVSPVGVYPPLIPKAALGEEWGYEVKATLLESAEAVPAGRDHLHDIAGRRLESQQPDAAFLEDTRANGRCVVHATERIDERVVDGRLRGAGDSPWHLLVAPASVELSVMFCGRERRTAR